MTTTPAAPARWKDLCLDATDPRLLGSFWAAVLGRRWTEQDGGDGRVEGDAPRDTIWVNAVPEPRSVKNRVHLDIEVGSLAPLLVAGATVLRPEGDDGIRWTVLADPEGGEFCAFRREDLPPHGPARLYEIVVDTLDAGSAHRQASWWAGVLGGRVVDDERGFAWLEAVPDLPVASLDFVPVPERKSAKNRIHWDVTTDDLPALLRHGATVLAGPTDRTPWHVLADPEGNEFCAFPAG
ncbi:MAG TPA: VOC family protein [Jiangellales bacterium]|nr:VOC family protein [Jiangellales bacterium]